MIRIKQIHSTTSTEVKDVLVGLPVKIDYQPTKREQAYEIELKAYQTKVKKLEKEAAMVPALQLRIQELEKEVAQLRNVDRNTKLAQNGDVSIPSTEHTEKKPIKMRIGQTLPKKEVQEQQNNVTLNNRPPPITTTNLLRPASQHGTTSQKSMTGWLDHPNYRQPDMSRYSPINNQNTLQPTTNQMFHYNTRHS